MSFRFFLVSLVPLFGVPCFAPAQVQEEDFRTYTEHPRLLLTTRRLRLLRREKERRSIRWQQFETLMGARVQMPEPGFALALYHQVTQNPAPCKEAAEWALGPDSGLRQAALVYDWCQAALSPSQSRSLAARLKLGLEKTSAAGDIPAVRDRVFAAIALAEVEPALAEKILRQSIETWWRTSMVPAIKSGRDVLAGDEGYALFEILHAVRDNLNIDLRKPVPGYFKDLPTYHLLRYYPAPYPGSENEFRIPAAKGGGDPDLKRAIMSRAAELAMVGFDSTTLENQFLQGWLIHDRYLMRGPFGIPYEFLWANPYLPGLSYYHMPLAYHDSTHGRLFLRSNWEDEATWLGYFDGELQVFDQGELKLVKEQPADKPIRLGDALVLFYRNNTRFSLNQDGVKIVFVVGLKPRQSYNIEVDDEEMFEQRADPGGILALNIQTRPGLEMRLQ